MRHFRFTVVAVLVASCGASMGVEGDEDPAVSAAESALVGGSAVNPSFETSLLGWAGYNASLSRVAVADAAHGSYVAKVTRAAGTSFTIDDNTETVSSTVGGRVYTATVYVKAASASSVGKSLVAKLRERLPSGALRQTSSPVHALTNQFVKVSVQLQSAATGSHLELYVAQLNAGSGDAFYADNLTLVAQGEAPSDAGAGGSGGGNTTVDAGAGGSGGGNAAVDAGAGGSGGGSAAVDAGAGGGGGSVVVIDAGAPSVAWKWNARTAPLDPDNAALTAQFLANGLKSPNFAMTDWAVATADAKSGDPEYSIPRTSQGGSITVRIPLGTRPDPSGDGHLTVRDVERGIETDFWQAVYDPTTQRIVRTTAAVSFPLNAVNAQTTGWSGNAANTPLRRGLVTPEAIAAGVIHETLQVSMPNIAGTTSSYRFPALHNAPTGTNNSLAEGTWIRLDPTVNVDALNIAPWEKVIARALQDHGAINRDNGGTFCVYGHNPINGGASWSTVGLSGTAKAFSAAFPWNRIQVLAPPPK